MSNKRRLDRQRVNIMTAAEDHVLAAAAQRHISRRVDDRKLAGNEPARRTLSEKQIAILRRIEVSRRDAWPAHRQDTRGAGCQRLIDASDIDGEAASPVVRKGDTNRAQARSRRDRIPDESTVQLGHAPDLIQWNSKLVFEFTRGLNRDGATAGEVHVHRRSAPCAMGSE